MALSQDELVTIRRARKKMRTDEFLTGYKASVEQSRKHYSSVAEKREPSPDRLKEAFTF